MTVSSKDRMLAGIYRFKAINALDFTPVRSLIGKYSISNKETGEWVSDRQGGVYLEHLKVGMTNIVVHDNSRFFDLAINGARVVKGESTRQESIFGRTALLVPKTLADEILMTLTWVGADYQLNLMAETFINDSQSVNSES